MNINDVKELKQYYESQLQTKVASLLGLAAEAIKVQWSLEQTILTVTINQQNNVITTFVFEYNGVDFIIHTSSYQMIAQDSVPNGIIVGRATISLNTIHAIFDTFIEVLNDSTDEDTSDCDCEECRGESNAN